MLFHLNQTVYVSGYFTCAKYLYGSASDIETNVGYAYGRLAKGFLVACLQRIPDITEFDLAGYSITPKHRFKTPEDLDIDKLKKMAKEVMMNEGSRNLVKIFPHIRHDDNIKPDNQYPYGKGGIPQWNLTKDFPMYIFKEVGANYKGNISLSEY